MRTTKRFTPNLLDRFRALRRGEGTYETYVAWHRVTRGDPASRGRSHVVVWRGRQCHLLSDLELVSFIFAMMLPNINDIREQFPLSLENGTHELSGYDVRYLAVEHPGTLDLAKTLEIKHPRVNGNGRSAPWVLTTDLLLTIVDESGCNSLLAVAVKPANKLRKKRTRQLLELEREYWNVRNVPWLLITDETFSERIGWMLRNIEPWIFGNQVDDATRLMATNYCLASGQLMSLTNILEGISRTVGDMYAAQQALWQSVVRGELSISLDRGWRPHEPLALITHEEFVKQNPIASRRSAWN